VCHWSWWPLQSMGLGAAYTIQYINSQNLLSVLGIAKEDYDRAFGSTESRRVAWEGLTFSHSAIPNSRFLDLLRREYVNPIQTNKKEARGLLWRSGTFRIHSLAQCFDLTNFLLNVYPSWFRVSFQQKEKLRSLRTISTFAGNFKLRVAAELFHGPSS